ncbi:PEP-CTERM/exosortase system-associated acyltransferase [Accumulibacter sp.]|uniref:PEP-CTERM/exosortase system-associated acyltransferase n=1 Tax=Accumulibacter sp. TaxID=2053492 RepID=UPI0025D06040|nr:PEP-CTERM/exosortase system-associated acyltransferase [Accumulibacter sp.]MCM8610892.1 PEP-CTERM/exosortase system-associated acyltransferase [Accumulibacter sp.]MCM8634712.1 PEP-CTERM/exosortase system-associated acyltransferase [Accumulibacter sp.]MCM8638266.1 PEP-CTERM/exosortase system-associated acyltransferase [Accumulibacter sp.]
MFLPSLTELTVSEGYRRYFTVVPALTSDLRTRNYRLRHQVYCRELGFEPVNPDGLERDEFDARSVHCLVQSVASGLDVGCARLVLLDPEEPAGQLPVELACAQTIDRALVSAMAGERSRIAEISRLAVIGSYRRRQGEQDRPISISEADFGTSERPRQPYLALAVYLSLIALARQYRVSILLVLSERKLATNLARLGVRLQQIGQPVDHRGMRIPSLLRVEQVIDGMSEPLRALFQLISHELCQGIEAAGASAVRANHRPLECASGTLRMPPPCLAVIAADGSAHAPVDA